MDVGMRSQPFVVFLVRSVISVCKKKLNFNNGLVFDGLYWNEESWKN